MEIIVGLGNLGKKFEKTRHNLGFRVIDELARKNKFPDFKLGKKLLAKISQEEINEKEIILAKPQTFMNLSGKAVKLITRRYNLDPKNLIVIHDDLDLPLGKIKIVKNRGSAGHKGVQSIIDELKTKDFIRIRVGIKNQKIKNRKQKIEDFVLKRFKKKEEKKLKGIIEKTCRAIEMAIKEGVEKAMQKFNC